MINNKASLKQLNIYIGISPHTKFLKNQLIKLRREELRGKYSPLLPSIKRA